jgi:hypothetical protein
MASMAGSPVGSTAPGRIDAASAPPTRDSCFVLARIDAAVR